MAVVNRKIAAAGIALVASLAAQLVQGQDYVDVEAERAAATTPAPNDPYAPRGTQTYPATSYGVGTAPPGTGVAPAGTAPRPVTGAATAVAPAAGQSQNLGTLFNQVQQLQQEVMRLNGRLEEQANELRTLREQSLERYVDLDKRLSSGAVGAAAAAGAGPAQTDVLPPAAATPATGAPTVAAQPGEAEAYRAAYSLVQAQKFDQAVSAFRQFQQDYPGGKFAPNAYYWLGELYLVVQPPDLESSRQSFSMLLGQYPNDSKAPDALYKLAKVQFMKGNREKAREYLDQVISRYGSTNSSAVKLARDFLAENY